jgi:hypothetical protein
MPVARVLMSSELERRKSFSRTGLNRREGLAGAVEWVELSILSLATVVAGVGVGAVPLIALIPKLRRSRKE